MIDTTEEIIMKNWQGAAKNPVVSICCITYNHGKFIEEALDCFLMQQTNFPFEIVIDDDCSTDCTAKIIKKYIEKFPNIISAQLRDKNVGASNNALGCIARAEGEFFALCEGDDFWSVTHKLQHQISKMQKYDVCDISFHPVTIKNDFMESDSEFNNFALKGAPEKVKLINNKLTFAQYYDKTQIIGSDKIFFKKDGIYIPTSSIIINKNALLEIPSFFADQPILDFLFQLLGFARGGGLYINEIMGAYRIHPTGMASSDIHNSKKVFKTEIDVTYSLIKMDTFMYPKFHKEFTTIISNRWNAFFMKKSYSVIEFIEVFLIFNSYLSIKQKEQFLNDLHDKLIEDTTFNKNLNEIEIQNIDEVISILQRVNPQLTQKLISVFN